MLLQSYRKEIFRADCNHNFESVHCHAHLDQDVGECLPYLNAELGGFEYIDEPRSVTFRSQGKIITVHPRMIAVNALKDASDADKILEWLKNEINDAWERRDEIEPSYESAPRPSLLEILKLLPKTNCKKCGQPTCMVFASQAAEGGRSAENCPDLADPELSMLRDYLERFFG